MAWLVFGSFHWSCLNHEWLKWFWNVQLKSKRNHLSEARYIICSFCCGHGLNDTSSEMLLFYFCRFRLLRDTRVRCFHFSFWVVVCSSSQGFFCCLSHVLTAENCNRWLFKATIRVIYGTDLLLRMHHSNSRDSVWSNFQTFEANYHSTCLLCQWSRWFGQTLVGSNERMYEDIWRTWRQSLDAGSKQKGRPVDHWQRWF